MYHQGSTLGRFREGHAEVVSMGSQSCLRGSKLKKRILKSIVILNVVAILMLVTAVPAFAVTGGPPGPPDTSALPNQDPPANDAGHVASCGAQEDNLDREAGSSESAPSRHALEFNHDQQC